MVISTLRYLSILVVIATLSAQATSVQSAERFDPKRDRDQAARRARKAQSEFDAVTLQALIAPMFSGIKGGPLGSGQAGRYWQSLMTEHIARQIASSGQLKLLKAIPETPHVARRSAIIPSDVRRSADVSSRGTPTSSWETKVHAASRDDPIYLDKSK